MKYIDSHAHYLSKRFNEDRYELLNKLLETELAVIIECGTNSNSNKRVIDLCSKYKNVYGVIGFFPTDVKELENRGTYNTLKKQLESEKIVGLGEIGLDYYHDEKGKEKQKKYFIQQLELARELNLPVCIHSREAEKDTVGILKEFGEYKGVIHCYAYGVKSMEELVQLGYSFGVGGTVTYSNNYDLRDAVKNMPLERILLETDCPYLSPQAVRRQRNDSSNIGYIIKEIAKLKNISEENIINSTNNNVYTLYNKIKNI